MNGVNSIGDFIRSVFSSRISRQNEVFKALLADKEYEDGTMESLFKDMYVSIDRWGNSDVYTQYGEQLDRTFEYFSGLNRMFEEQDKDWSFRNWLIFTRTGDDLWGDYWNCLRVLRTYFGTKYVYIVNNTDDMEYNLIQNHDFEHEEIWEISGSCEYSRRARFSECNGILFHDTASMKQTCEIETDKAYFLHFFLKGKINVSIVSGDGRYWNKDSGEFGEWLNEKTTVTFDCDDWDNCSLCFWADDNSTVTICFEYAGDEACIDYVRMFKKLPYPTFTVIGMFNGVYTGETASLAPYRDDPAYRPDFDLFGYQQAGLDDRDPEKQINYDNADYSDNSALVKNESPAVVKGQDGIRDDGEYKENSYADYFNESDILAGTTPYHKDDFTPIDYEIASYWNQAFIYGAGGIRSKSAYDELIEYIKAAGTKYFTEMLIREGEELDSTE